MNNGEGQASSWLSSEMFYVSTRFESTMVTYLLQGTALGPADCDRDHSLTKSGRRT